MNKEVSCIIVDDEKVAREILETHLDKIPDIRIVASCKNALEAFQAINMHTVDLIFLDINMPDISGLALAKAIGHDVKIIFTTAYREYAVDGFDLQAVDYLLKPISFERLLQAIQKYMGETHRKVSENANRPEEYQDFIFVRADRKMIKLVFSEIRYIESLGDYLRIDSLDEPVVTRETISNIEARLPKDDFIRVHRSFIISRAHIRSYTNEWVDVGDKQIPISRSYKQQVINHLEPNS